MANFLCLNGDTGSPLQTRLLFLRVVYMLYDHANHQGGVADAKVHCTSPAPFFSALPLVTRCRQ